MGLSYGAHRHSKVGLVQLPRRWLRPGLGGSEGLRNLTGQTAVKCITVSNPWCAFFVRYMTEFFMSRGDLTQTC